MEVLIAALAELAVFALTALVGAIAAFMTAAFGALGLLADLLSGAAGLAADAIDASGKPRERARWRKFVRPAKWMLGVGGGLLALFFLAVAVCDAFLFEPTLRFVAGLAASRTGVAIAFDGARGSLWRGEARIEGVSLVREGHPRDNFRLRGGRVEVDLDVGRLLLWSIDFERLRIADLRGDWERVARTDGLRPKRRFSLSGLSLENIEIGIVDRSRGNPVEVDLRIDAMEFSTIHSDWALLAVLFGSAGRGAVNGIPFVADSRSGEHAFSMDGVPVRLAAAYVGGPLDWFESGVMDVFVRDRLGGDDIRMHWSLVFRDFRVRAPEGTGRARRAAAWPLVAWLNRKSKRLPLEFELSVEEREFRFKSSSELEFLATLAGKALFAVLRRLKAEDDPGGRED